MKTMKKTLISVAVLLSVTAVAQDTAKIEQTNSPLTISGNFEANYSYEFNNAEKK